MTTTTAPRLATPRQLALLPTLRQERGLRALTDAELAGLTFDEASRQISATIALPRPARAPQAPARAPRPTLEGLPLCKYLVTGDAGQKVHLEVVERRNGRRFVNVLIGAPGDWRRQNVAYATQLSFAAKIRDAEYFDAIGGQQLSGPEAAAVRFSREHKCCAACLSPLSDESQPGYAVGLGPVCRTRFGY